MTKDCIILAGGSSTRFETTLPKVFYPFINKPIIDHILDKISLLNFEKIIIVTGLRTHDLFEPYIEKYNAIRVMQKQPNGTWDAVVQGLSEVISKEVMIINADLPLVSFDILKKVYQSPSDLTIVSTNHPDPYGYGRIIRNEDNHFLEIIEEKNLNNTQKKINEINAGIYKFQSSILKNKKNITPDELTHEWYLTKFWDSSSDFIFDTNVIFEKDHRIVSGINTFSQLEELETFYYEIQRERLVRAGVFLKNSKNIFIEETVQVEANVIINGPCYIKGNTILKEGSIVEPFTTIIDSKIGSDNHVKSYSLIEQTQSATACHLGPFLRSQEKTNLAEGVYLGSFVESKRCFLDQGSKAKHFSYIADATIGTRCNLGAFVVFCNYDGLKKHQAIIGNEVFIGSSSQLISPIYIGDYAFIGAGTTVTTNVDAKSLITRRAEIKIIQNWSRRRSCVE